MNKANQRSVWGVNLAIVIYYFLPRIQIATHTQLWNVFFHFRSMAVFLLTLGMLVICHQKLHLNRWAKVNLQRMVAGSYILYLVATLFYIMILEFI